MNPSFKGWEAVKKSRDEAFIFGILKQLKKITICYFAPWSNILYEGSVYFNFCHKFPCGLIQLAIFCKFGPTDLFF